MPEENHKISIGGIKFSEELIQVSIVKNGDSESTLVKLLHLIAEKKITLHFLCHSLIPEASTTSFCVLKEDFGVLQTILNFSLLADLDIEVIQSVGAITLFPHRNSFFLLGLILRTLGEFQFPVYSLSTSISAVAINTDYSCLDAATEKLLSVVTLPDNHAPFRQEFCLKQI